MIEFTVRHLRRHWRLNVAVLLCLTLASALVAGLSSYAAAAAARELDQSLAEVRSAERTLLITGTRYTFNEKLYELLQESLGPFLEDRMIIRYVTSPADGPPVIGEQVVALLDVYSFDKLPENTRVIEGRLPASIRLREAEESWRPPPMEAVIGARAAEQSGYGVGDRLTGSGAFHRLDIVGIVEPLDPSDDIWGEDLGAFAIRDLGADVVALPLIIDPVSMRSSYPATPIFWHEVSWRITLNHCLINVDQAAALHSGLLNFQTQSATKRATLNTGLVQILADYLARLSRVRMMFILLTAQTLIFVLYTLTMLTSVIVDRSTVELATLSGQGASVWQITRMFALESLILALPAALLLGPGLALGVIRLWGEIAGAAMPSRLPGEAWLLSGVAVGLGWLSLVWPVFLAARRGRVGWELVRARPPQQSLAQKRYLDLYLLAFGGLLFWQLNQSGSIVLRAVARRGLENTQLADPLLLIGPSLLLIGVAMIFSRLLPYLLRLVAWFFRRLRGLALPLGLSRLARDPLQPSRVALLVSLTAGLVLFTRIFGDSLAASHGALRSDALVQGVGGALQLNAVTLVLFSVTAFFLAHFFAAQGRMRSQGGACEFGILRAMGLSPRQWLVLLIVEAIPVLLLGLLAGIVVGLSLAHIMIPYLSQPLAESLGGVAIERIRVDWPAIVRLYVVLIGVYGAALTLLAALVRAGARQPLHIGDE
jgi:hypothetical protein